MVPRTTYRRVTIIGRTKEEGVNPSAPNQFDSRYDNNVESTGIQKQLAFGRNGVFEHRAYAKCNQNMT